MGFRLTPAIARRLVLLVLGLLLLGAAFETGRRVAGYSALSSLMQRQVLNSQLSALRDSNQKLQQRLAAGEVTHKVDKEAESEAQTLIGELQAELARQEQELDFYRGLVAEKFGTGTVKVQELAVRAEKGRQYTVLVTLVHTAARNSSATGSLTLTVTGSRGGALTRLDLKQLSADGRDRVSFTLRYFTTVEVPIELPAGFNPDSIELEFRSNRSGPDPVKQGFPWDGVLEPADGHALTPLVPAD